MKTRDIETAAEHRAPTIPEGDALVYDEPGRVLVLKPVGNYDVCFRAYWFRVTKRYGSFTLRVRHGGGEESWPLHGGIDKALETMDSDARFFTLHAIMDAHHESTRRARERTAERYMTAHAEGRLKRRKLRGQNAVKVWIEPARTINAHTGD